MYYLKTRYLPILGLNDCTLVVGYSLITNNKYLNEEREQQINRIYRGLRKVLWPNLSSFLDPS